MKMIELKGLLKEHFFDANDCVNLSLTQTGDEPVDWEVSAEAGCLWLSFESPLGKHSAVPLIDVLLRAGQTYQLPASALQRGVIVSTFEPSIARFSRRTQVPSCNGKNDTLSRFRQAGYIWSNCT
jgi:hypothetical protein